MIRELFMAIFMVFLAVTLTLWFAGAPSLDVTKVEASLAK